MHEISLLSKGTVSQEFLANLYFEIGLCMKRKKIQGAKNIPSNLVQLLQLGWFQYGDEKKVISLRIILNRIFQANFHKQFEKKISIYIQSLV